MFVCTQIIHVSPHTKFLPICRPDYRHKINYVTVICCHVVPLPWMDAHAYIRQDDYATGQIILHW